MCEVSVRGSTPMLPRFGPPFGEFREKEKGHASRSDAWPFGREKRGRESFHLPQQPRREKTPDPFFSSPTPFSPLDPFFSSRPLFLLFFSFFSPIISAAPRLPRQDPSQLAISLLPSAPRTIGS